MTKKSVGILTGLFFAILFVIAAGLTANEAPEDVDISNAGYKLDVRGSVPLSHLAHSEDYEWNATRVITCGMGKLPSKNVSNATTRP